MPPVRRSRQQPTDDWQQLRLLVTSPEQETYELLRPIVLFGQPTADARPGDRRARAHAAPQGRPLRCERGCAASSPSPHQRLTGSPAAAGRDPPGHRRAEGRVPAVRPARDRPRSAGTASTGRSSHHTVGRCSPAEPLPLHPPRRFPRYHEIPDPVAAAAGGRRRCTCDGWSTKRDRRLPGDRRAAVYETLRRWDAEGWPGLADRPLARASRRARSTSRRWPRSAGCRPTPSSASSASTPRWLSRASTSRPAPAAASWRCTGRWACPRRPRRMPHEPQPMPFAAAAAAPVLVGRHPLRRGPRPRHRQAGLRHLDPGELQPGPPGQRDLAAPGPDRLPDRAAGGGRGPRRAGGRSSATAAASSRPSRPRPSTRRLGIRKAADRPRAALAELHRDPLQRHAPHGRLPLRAGHDLGRAAGRPRAVLPRLQPASRTSPTGSGPTGAAVPAAVLGWVQGAWCEPADLDRLFRLRAHARAQRAAARVRFRHWRLYGERGLAGERAAVWVWERR